MSRYSLLILVLLVFLAGCMPSASQRGAGPGIETIIINQHEFRDVYFPYRGSARPTPESVQESVSNPSADLYEAFRLQLVVANTGRADGIAAIYITGYDPNLFVVHPFGPFTMDLGARSCWQGTAGRIDNQWDAYIACINERDMIGIGVQWGDERSLRLDTRDVNIGELLGRIPELWGGESSRALHFFDRVFGPVNLNCNWQGSRPEGDISIGGSSSGCSFSFRYPHEYLNRPSRGTLTLAHYAALVRDCKNGCILVPSALLAQDYLGGNTDQTPGGERVNIDVGVWVDRNRWPENYLRHDQLFQVSTCALYTTYLTPSVCIDPTPAVSAADKACVAGRIPLEQNQGAPIRVSRIDQVSQGPRIMFTIHVENVGGGRVFSPGAIDMCSPATPSVFSRELIDIVKVIDARLIGTTEALDCGTTGQIRLRDGRGQINCFYELTPQSVRAGAYQTALNLELGYLYRTTQTVQSTIHRI